MDSAETGGDTRKRVAGCSSKREPGRRGSPSTQRFARRSWNGRHAEASAVERGGGLVECPTKGLLDLRARDALDCGTLGYDDPRRDEQVGRRGRQLANSVPSVTCVRLRG